MTGFSSPETGALAAGVVALAWGAWYLDRAFGYGTRRAARRALVEAQARFRARHATLVQVPVRATGGGWQAREAGGVGGVGVAQVPVRAWPVGERVVVDGDARVHGALAEGADGWIVGRLEDAAPGAGFRAGAARLAPVDGVYLAGREPVAWSALAGWPAAAIDAPARPTPPAWLGVGAVLLLVLHLGVHLGVFAEAPPARAGEIVLELEVRGPGASQILAGPANDWSPLEDGTPCALVAQFGPGRPVDLDVRPTCGGRPLAWRDGMAYVADDVPAHDLVLRCRLLQQRWPEGRWRFALDCADGPARNVMLGWNSESTRVAISTRSGGEQQVLRVRKATLPQVPLLRERPGTIYAWASARSTAVGFAALGLGLAALALVIGGVAALAPRQNPVWYALAVVVPFTVMGVWLAFRPLPDSHGLAGAVLLLGGGEILARLSGSRRRAPSART